MSLFYLLQLNLLHYASLEKFTATLLQSLPEVEVEAKDGFWPLRDMLPKNIA